MKTKEELRKFAKEVLQRAAAEKKELAKEKGCYSVRLIENGKRKVSDD